MRLQLRIGIQYDSREVRRDVDRYERNAGPDREVPRVKLLIAIPALDEEESIEDVIRRSLEAKAYVLANSPVTEVGVTVVSDGSTDRTVELAERFADQIRLIVFPQNRGYGAAIRAAWRESDAELLGFLDADGTCDPCHFAALCRTLCDEGADVVLGNRMNGESRMPVMRRLGNLIFAGMLSMFSSNPVRDAASGMRVVRRSSLPELLPLPDGLHFTPAMSARAILSHDLKILEVDIPYHERQGESKLKLFRDGLRFLKVILEAGLLYRPSRLLGLVGVLCLGGACFLMAMPTSYFIEHREVLEWMIYRFVVSNLAGSCGCMFLATSYLVEKIVRVTLAPRPAEQRRGPVAKFLSSRLFWLAPLALMTAGGLLVLPSFRELVATGATYEHWSRFIVMSFLFEVAIILVVTRIADLSLGLLAERLAYLGSLRRPGSSSEKGQA